MRLARLLLAAVFAVLATFAAAEVAVPPLQWRVTDLTDTLTAAQRTALEERLHAFETRKGSQIAVLIVPTTQPETIEQYGIRVVDAWKLGRKGVDDGALMLVALQDRAVRIEVGYGLEGVLPDAIAKRIIDEEVLPRFRQKDYYGGIEAGVGRMVRVAEGEPLPPPRSAKPSPGGSIGLQEIFVMGVMLVFVAGGVLRALFGRLFGSGLVGAVGAFVAWLLIGSLAAAIVLGVIMAIVSAVAGVAPRGRGGWYPGGGWSSGGGGFGGGGGGFGGGGGGFGGGGASGRW